MERIAELVGRPDLVELGALEAAADEPPLLVADVGRLRDEVGWSPSRSLDEGLRDTVEWWRLRPRLCLKTISASFTRRAPAVGSTSVITT